MEAARIAALSDLDAVVDLAAKMRAELADQRGGAIWLARDARAEPLADAYAALMGQPDAAVIAGTIHDSVVGFATVELERLRDQSVLAVVRDLYVEPAARAVGVGEAIAERIVDYARAAGCFGIDAYALPGARETKNFYERSGFVARVLTMHHRL